MAKVNIDVTLHEGESGYGAVRYRPGDILRGTVVVDPDEDVRCNHLFVMLVWHTEGRGTRYQEEAEQLDLFQGTLKVGFPRSFDFTFHLPPEPWSYAGYYISIVWEVQVKIDVPWKRDPKHSLPFIMTPDRETVSL
ncbi:MAG: hypothetical protein ACE5E7_06015 [Anaerolineae bacterium]